ncbi:MAG: hypothetical protein Q4E86_14345 [Lachnospiraceae bacterium]|nr:hypothetical protein [Lachnospiraceae bacterium]
MLEYLQKDPISHIDMLEPLRRGTAEILYDGEDGVMILETRSQIYMISMEQEEKCFQILKHYPPAVYAVHQKNIASALQEQYHFPEFHPCYQYRYPYEALNEEKLTEAGITEKEISQERTPFCQVFEGNVVSERLQQKLGLERSKQMTWWLF